MQFLYGTVVFATFIGLTFVLAQTNPLKDPEICGRPTCLGSGKFKYNPGTEYHYNYSVNVSTLFRGTSTNESALYINAKAVLDFVTECDGLLRISGVEIREQVRTIKRTDGDEEEVPQGNDLDQDQEDEEEEQRQLRNSELFDEAITMHTLRFAFVDGQIHELCPDEEDPSWVLNFKRGLLSMIHNSMVRFDLDHVSTEDDVRGRCPTKYMVDGANGTSLIITKSKDLTDCESRAKLHSMVQSTPYRFRREQGEKLLKSHASCSLSIDHHIYNDINCTETHVFQPFSGKERDGDSGATTVVRQRLVLVAEERRSGGAASADDQPSVERRVRLLYDPVPTAKPTSGELKTSRDLVKKLCVQTDDDVQSDFSDLFTRFVHAARLLSYPALESLYNHASTICPTGKKHVLDALPYLGSSAAVSLMSDVILRGQLAVTTVHEWLLAVALIPRPNDVMLTAMLELLRAQGEPDAAKPLDANVVLAVGTITYTYCVQYHAAEVNGGRTDDGDCRDSEPAAQIMSMMEEWLTQAYTSGLKDRETENRILLTLKALGNIGEPSEVLLSTLHEMIADHKLSMASRVGAVDAHRRFPCLESRQYFEELFRMVDEDPELRIGAYLQVMKCPNYAVIRNIRNVLETEEVNQVSSFIASHLQKLLQSSIPSRVEIQGLLSDLTKKFGSDVRKFSHNYEESVFFEQYNVGASYESNVIFSPTSYIPKFAMLNLTVDLFGESINLLEVYGRAEGFEHFLESLFGPRGPLNARKFEHILPKMRWGRDVSKPSLAEESSPSPASLKSQINSLPNVIADDFAAAPKLSLGLKVFGNELKYGTFRGLNEMRTALNAFNPIDHLKRLLSGKEINYSKAAMFLDTSYVVPSAAGLPITLNAIGTTSVNLRLYGHLGSTSSNFMETRELDVTGHIQPSVALDVIGTMSVDAYHAQTAIKLKTSVYTSSAVEGSVKIRGGKLVTIKFGIPKKTTEIFGAKSELIVVRHDVEESQAGTDDDRVSETLCSWPSVDKTVGLKLCADYHFTNVTRSNASLTDYLLAGPAGCRLALHKADPTATTYLLEYRWTDTTTGSEVSLTFDTPGSSVRRLLGANLTLDRDSQNLTLLLQSTEGSVLARGKYKNTPMEKYLQLGLDINGQRNFDALLALEQQPIRNGFLFVPKLYLGVNGARVAELEGTLKWVTKAEVSQCDCNLKFQTKRLTSKLFGYISRTSASFRSNLKLDYRFANTKEQTVTTDFYLQDRSTPTINTFLGEASVITTAYPNYNFNSSLKFQKSAGHVECKLLLNASPHLKEKLDDDEDLLAVEVFLSFRTLINSTRFKGTASLSKQSTDLDMLADLAYDLMGRTHDVKLLARYAKEKDVHVTVYYTHPRQTLEYIEGRLNISVPNFTPMTLEVRVREKSTADYNVDLSGTWFSGHSLSVIGLYEDKSNVRAAAHHLKMFIQSPSFAKINADFQYYRDSVDFKIDLKASQDQDEYAVLVKHSAKSKYDIMSHGKLKYKTRMYSISTALSLKEHRQISLELHLDQYRDIHISAWGYSQEKRKAAGIELKYDANRDPNQKLAVGVDYSNPMPYNHEANFDISYPSKTIKGVFNFTFTDGHLSTIGQVAWSPDDAFAIRVNADYHFYDEILVYLRTDLITPFDEWKKSSINLGFHHLDNMYRANGSVYWQQNQHIALDFFGNYSSTDGALRCEYTGSLDSTVQDIPALSASVKHNHNATKVFTNVHIMYHPTQIVAVTSSWQIDEDDRTKNLTGTVLLESPFRGLNKGLLVSKMYVTSDRDLRGVANLDLDHQEFTVSVEGHLAKLSRSMLVFNITSPIEKFRTIRGRFGFSEANRHLVAMVAHPSGSLGVEVQFLVHSLSNFNTKFHLGTPIEFLQEILIVGKLQREEADFRIGWNSLLAGVGGVWHYANVTDFEYSFKIYTPIDGFEENGIVAKLILKDGLDSELSVRLAEHRLGVSIAGKPEPKTLKELGIKTQAIYLGKISGASQDDTEDGDDTEDDATETDDIDDDQDPFNWSGNVRLDTLLYRTIEATVDIDQKGTIYDMVATLTLPHGKAELRNEFDFKDIYTMKNRLSINTPYTSCREVTSNYELRLVSGQQYLLALDLSYLNGTRWIKSGGRAHYLRQTISGTAKYHDEARRYNVTLHLHTPLDSFPRLDTAASVRLGGGGIYAADFFMRTNGSNVLLATDVEMRDPFVDAHLDAHVQTPMLSLPPVKLIFRKDFHEANGGNKINIVFDMPKNNFNKFILDSKWNYRSMKNFNLDMDMKTPFRGMEVSKVKLDMEIVDRNTATAAVTLLLHPLSLSANASLRNEIVLSSLVLDFNGKSQTVEVNGTITPSDAEERTLKALLLVNGKPHDVTGTYRTTNDLLSNVDIVMMNLDTEENTQPLQVSYQMDEVIDGYVLQSTMKQGSMNIHVAGNTTIHDKLNWDLQIKIDTSHKQYKSFTIHAFTDTVVSNQNTKTIIAVEAATPFARMEKPRFRATISKTQNVGDGRGADTADFADALYELGDNRGNLTASWCWLTLEDMRIALVGNYHRANRDQTANINAYYVNAARAFRPLKIGGSVVLDKIWSMASNATLSLPGGGNVDVEANVQLPPPTGEYHYARGKFGSERNFTDIDFIGRYKTKYSGLNYGSSGKVSYGNKSHINGDVAIEWSSNRINNFFDLEKRGEITTVQYLLHTPKFDQAAIVANVTYQNWQGYYNTTCKIFYPANRTVAQTRVNFKAFANMDGHVNITTPFRGLNFSGANFHTDTTEDLNNRYIEAFWGNNTAVIDSKCAMSTVMVAADSERRTVGVLLLEMPLTTRHIARVDYGYNKKPSLTTGTASVQYKDDRVLHGMYNCITETEPGMDRDTIHVELENKVVPVGADYIHVNRYNGDEHSKPAVDDAPTADYKWVHIYNLHNRSAFNVSGELEMRTTSTGQNFTVAVTHSNRTVRLWTDYDILDSRRFRQHSRIQLAPTAWLAYEIDLLNKTTNASTEAQHVQINLLYPRRNFTVLGAYEIGPSSLSTEAGLGWDNNGPKTVQAAFRWHREPTAPHKQEVLFEIKHPSFQKNVTFRGEYHTTRTTLADVRLTVDYAPEEDRTVYMRTVLENHAYLNGFTTRSARNITYGIWASQLATNLGLKTIGGMQYRPRWYFSGHQLHYQRSYLPMQLAEASTRLDLDRNEIELKRKTLQELSYFWGRYAGRFPLYTSNVSATHGKDINATGEFYLNFREKLLQLELNMTSDGSQSMHMYGIIPDARSGTFDVWRDYDDIRVRDIAYYLRMNHSRLLVSSLRWRPDLKQEVKNAIRRSSVGLYNDIMESTDNWREYIRSETAEAILDIWNDAKPLVQGFLDDVKDLRVIEEDLEELKLFLNESYNANEFYIRDMASVVIYLVDELSIRTQLESLPEIVSEVWDVMGESGKKIQKSILWVIQKIKGYYKNAAEFINGLFQGDSMEHLSEAMKQLAEKYDSFIKKMHVMFIQYMEQLWQHTYKMLLDNWHKTLAAIEPTFIKFVHYLETIVYSASVEFLDFLYVRKNEIIDNPYFSKIANFTHDLDRFYTDITGNDTLGSIYKYATIGWNFVQERFVKLVPFGTELKDVISEIWNEVYELRHLPSVQYIIGKYTEMEGHVKWFSARIDLENRLHRLMTLIHQKVTDMQRTALQSENQYREAKTKFIFEPSDGIMLLEQKLPMSMHAFNQTPKFEEIPEYKMFNDIQNFFSTSNSSLSALYYDYTLYLTKDPHDLMPPFRAQAMIAGSRYYITFDRVLYEFEPSAGCSYLLAADFIDGNFSVAMSPDSTRPHEHDLLVLVEDTVVTINVFKETVRVGNETQSRLPVQIGQSAILYQETEIVVLKSTLGFKLECNMKFDVCTLQVSGWYFGKTAGLWGTINNEPYDDLRSSDRKRCLASELKTFTNSWQLVAPGKQTSQSRHRCSSTSTVGSVLSADANGDGGEDGDQAAITGAGEDVKTLCQSLFASRMSPFAKCFPRVAEQRFYRMCVESGNTDKDSRSHSDDTMGVLHGACTTAVAYMDLCAYANVLLRIPDACVMCKLPNGTMVPEGRFVSMPAESVPSSADVVFIVEAKECNSNMRQKRRMDFVVKELETELTALGITNNRYSLVVFGGEGVLDVPRSISIDSHVFTDHRTIATYFDHIHTGKGNLDIFNAITFATKLLYRPAVSKTFIMLPCTDCDERHMKLDYTIPHQLLLENGITFHILMNDEFRFKKTRESKIFFGLDRTLAYTRKDADSFHGDGQLRKHVFLPKANLRYCTPLALETNGSVFSAKKLEKPKLAPKIAQVFAKRVAQTAKPDSCKTCECTAHNSGVAYMECLPCSYPSPINIDYGFEDDDLFDDND